MPVNEALSAVSTESFVEKNEIEALMLKQEAADAEKNGDKQSPLMEKAIALLGTTSFVSISFIQRRLGLGYPKAARFIDMMEQDRIIGPGQGAKPREVLVGPEYLAKRGR